MHPSKFAKASQTVFFLLIGIGAILAGYSLLIDPTPYRQVLPFPLIQRLPFSIQEIDFGFFSFPIEVDKFIVFQEYKSLPPRTFIPQSLGFGLLIWLISSVFLAFLSYFRKVFFVLGGSLWIVLLTISNLNALNVGGQYTILPLLIGIVGSLSLPIYFFISGKNHALWIRFFSILSLMGVSGWILVSASTLPDPGLFLSEHSLILGLIFSLVWLFWNGHSVVSGAYLFLVRSQRNLGLRISIQMLFLAGLYLVVLFNLFRNLSGNSLSWIPVFSPLLLILPIGILGSFVLKAKIQQTDLPVAPAGVLWALHLLGFVASFWVVWKVKISGNQAAEDLMSHLLVYTQLSFSFLFLIYLLSNFLQVMDTGKRVDRVLFKPLFFPYYHLRIGGLIVMLVIITYTDAVVAVQARAVSNSILGDYYYHTGQSLEARILYENSWLYYRRNQKAKNAVAHLLLEEKQPSQAKKHLEQSFYEAPQTDNILLWAEQLIRENQLTKGLNVLQEGLFKFPENEAIRTNLALRYLKLNRKEEALRLFSEPSSRQQITKTNELAARLLSDQPIPDLPKPNTLPVRINLLALPQLDPDEGELILQKTKSTWENSPSSALKLAALRNIYAIPATTDPDEDLLLLENLWQNEQMAPFTMELQETAIIRSLQAGRIADAVKNLNGLAFRNAENAGYFHNQAASILASQLDFQKASTEILAAHQAGYQAIRPYHLAILMIADRTQEADQLQETYTLSNPLDTLPESNMQSLRLLARFNQSLPQQVFTEWKNLENESLKLTLCKRILLSKSHDLSKTAMQELSSYLQKREGENVHLREFVENPDWTDAKAVQSFLKWVGKGDELTANPYYSPLIWSAQSIQTDPLRQYEILHNATEFNQDPILWIRKVQVARDLGLDKYATEALQTMRGWTSAEHMEELQMRK